MRRVKIYSEDSPYLNNFLGFIGTEGLLLRALHGAPGEPIDINLEFANLCH